jgi:hypothetical protein
MHEVWFSPPYLRGTVKPEIGDQIKKHLPLLVGWTDGPSKGHSHVLVWETN